MEANQDFRLGADFAELVLNCVRAQTGELGGVTLGEIQRAFAGDVTHGALPLSAALDTLQANLEALPNAADSLENLHTFRARMQRQQLLDKGWFEDCDDPEVVSDEFRTGYIIYIASGGMKE
ncbi:MAG: hypothetical protein Q4D04_09760 [Clostridia bacterium]|nr:hypothetical protein [Clostridia bacterium]